MKKRRNPTWLRKYWFKKGHRAKKARSKKTTTKRTGKMGKKSSGIMGLVNSGLKLAGVVFIIKTLVNATGIDNKLGSAATNAGIKLYG